MATGTQFVARAVRRDMAPDITQRKRSELLELARRWHLARDHYIRRLSSSSDIAAVVLRPRVLRERQRDEGWAPVDLTVHYHQTAFLSAAAHVKTCWLATFGRIRWRAGRRQDLSDAQKHWIRAVTRRPDLIQRLLEGITIALDADWASTIDQGRESRRLRRLIWHAHGAPRRGRRRNWFNADGRLYRHFHRDADRHYRGAWITLTGLTRGGRIRLPLVGRTHDHLAPRDGCKEGPEVRIEIGERVVIRGMQRVQPVNTERDLEAGVDKGHDTVAMFSLGDPATAIGYGAGVGERVSTETLLTEEAQKFRRRLVAYERSLRNSAPQKARRIRRRNLGAHRRSRESKKVSGRLREMVDQALNRLFRENLRVRKLHVEALDFVGPRRGHAFNRRLRRWLKGYLQRRLAYKAELNGVELNVVNAAYTSQTCPRCWFTSAKNRRAQRFECGSCGFTGSADAVAATNVLRRGSDSAITRFMPSGAVKQILDERWRAALSGGAWGSNGIVPGDDVTRGLAIAGAANNCLSQSIGTGLELQPSSPPGQGSNRTRSSRRIEDTGT